MARAAHHAADVQSSPIFALRNRLTFLIVNLIVFKECGRFM
jgi:hypothetical protein